MALTGILQEVTQTRVAGLLHERRPDILEDDPDQVVLFEGRVRGAAVEVVLLTGHDPVAGMVRDLAVEAIATQAASEIEYATYPEQQAAGDVGRGYHLHQRYLELMARLRAIVENAGGKVPEDSAITTTRSRPRGRFPDPARYPDPVQVLGRRRGREWSP